MTENLLILALLCAMVGLALILSSKVLALCIRKTSSWRWLRVIGIALWTLCTLLLVLDVIEASRSLYYGRRHILVEMILLGILVAFAWTGMHFFSLRSHTPAPSVLRQCCTIAFLFLLMGWSYYRIETRSSSYLSYGLIGTTPGSVELDDRFFCETDTGTSIPVFRWATANSAFLSFSRTFRERYANFGNALIHRGDADQQANCHGWVFTGGKFLLKGEDVERILKDHEYSKVEVPREGDIVVYRSNTGAILHTALVQAVLNDGTVITESKWGVEQRFLHLPDDQPYSNIYNYYRTNRPYHLVRIRPTMNGPDSNNKSSTSRQLRSVEHG